MSPRGSRASAVPREQAVIAPFALTLAMSFLVGAGLREYYAGEHKLETFGTVRTFLLIGMLGFVLAGLPPIGVAYVAGLAALAALFAIYYIDKLKEKKGAGIIGILIGLLTFAFGPLARTQPAWVVVLLGISVLFVLHSKGPIRRFTDGLQAGEVLTVCKFLAIVAVVLPLMPSDVSSLTGWLGRAAALLPLSPQQLWWAVVIVTGISYAGYVAQVYVWPSAGMRAAGFIGGLGSSTATVLVIARRARDANARSAAAAILFAIAAMYIRLAALVGIFRPSLFAAALVPLAPLAIAAFAAGELLRRLGRRAAGTTGAPAPPRPRHPLELATAFAYAASFGAVAAATKFVLGLSPNFGLRWLSLAVGFSDVTPFVVSILHGNLAVDDVRAVHAIVAASASNNVLKAIYVRVAGTRALSRAATPALLVLAAVSLIYVELVGGW